MNKKYLCKNYEGKKVIVTMEGFNLAVGTLTKDDEHLDVDYTHRIDLPDHLNIPFNPLWVSDNPMHEQYSWIPQKRKLG